ncbi:hypothetical protein O2K51_08445 [Apibacter raozihei]|uniref:hypothetical protein n=1 Tax=Apibacter raozihei TaxID=2500547 RepID=UPI000FE3DD9E|nr:hypothetical protein [Apibacter raozihei]
MSINCKDPNIAQRFATLLGYARIIHGQYRESIRSTFEEQESCTFEYFDTKEVHKLMEIEFPEASLMCTFSEKGRCNFSGYIFKSLCNLIEYINYCNETYVYNVHTQSWEMDRCSLRLQLRKKKFIFSLVPLEMFN